MLSHAGGMWWMTYDQLDAAFAARAGTSVYEAATQSTATELDEALFREAEHGDPGPLCPIAGMSSPSSRARAEPAIVAVDSLSLRCDQHSSRQFDDPSFRRVAPKLPAGSALPIRGATRAGTRRGVL
jgi:hypothetical protein